MVRYDADGALVPSDTPRTRLFLGAFSFTTCCPEVFYRTEIGATEELTSTSEYTFTIAQLERAMYPQWNFRGELELLFVAC